MKDLITEARELCEKATPGPWVFSDTTDVCGCKGEFRAPSPHNGFMLVRAWCNDADIAFFTRARTLIPELCDALESYKSFADRIAKLPDCNDCVSNRDCPYLPNWGTTTRINCPLHKPLPAPQEVEE